MNKKILTPLTAISVLCLLGITSVFAQGHYDDKTQILHIPVIEHFSTDGVLLNVYQAEMQRLPEASEVTFVVKNLRELESAPINKGSILNRVRQKGQLTCGVRANSQAGFAFRDEKDRYDGFDIAFCRAVAMAVLNDPEAINFVPLTAAERGEALQSGRVDMLSRQTTWTTTRDAQWGDFTWIMFYDGQGFMVPANSDITKLQQLNGENICVTSGTTTESNLKNIFEQRGLTYTPVIFSSTEEAFNSYEGGKCIAITSDKSQLSALRNGFIDPDVHTILEITVSKEPLTPVVPHGDTQWLDLVKTVMMGLINAEELGITQANIDEMRTSTHLEVKRFMGTKGTFGQSELGLEANALAQVIRAVGNYGEIYDRYLGNNGLKIPRSINRLWTEGGLIYAPPLR
ncbi:MAG: amino acid ABC transporter substrate-binding protein [Candidatus Parabeggiatoa sp.]|nr:amino acid ABC transporter substrate-binding protein [Candidatus Parabeggiatoa sp.]